MSGGSVWKTWRFRDPESSDKTWVLPDKKQKVAVLTGVISRFEKQCGAFFPQSGAGDDPPVVQHTVHSRVQIHLDWIMRNVYNTSSCSSI